MPAGMRDREGAAWVILVHNLGGKVHAGLVLDGQGVDVGAEQDAVFLFVLAAALALEVSGDAVSDVLVAEVLELFDDELLGLDLTVG